MTDITQLLVRAANGEHQAANQLMPLIYEHLRTIAHRQLVHEPQRPTLATTLLVHETYLALFDGAELTWRDRGHFFAYAATAMRSILIDRARMRLANKRGSKMEYVDIADTDISVDDQCIDILALDQALTRMAQHHPRWAQVVELRFFAGLSVEDTALSLELDPRSVARDWQKARAFINRALDYSPFTQ